MPSVLWYPPVKIEPEDLELSVSRRKINSKPSKQELILFCICVCFLIHSEFPFILHHFDVVLQTADSLFFKCQGYFHHLLQTSCHHSVSLTDSDNSFSVSPPPIIHLLRTATDPKPLIYSSLSHCPLPLCIHCRSRARHCRCSGSKDVLLAKLPSLYRALRFVIYSTVGVFPRSTS